jgi:magnesium transporter
MDVCLISEEGAESRARDEVPSLLGGDEGIVWLDIPQPDETALCLLGEEFRFHPLALEDCALGSPLPKVHVYGDHAFVILHSVEDGDGHARVTQLFQFVGRRVLVTLHAARDDGPAGELSLRATTAVRERLLSGRLHPTSPAELSQTIVSGIMRQLESRVAAIARRTKALERDIMTASTSDPDQLLNDLFFLRHELLTVRTTTAEDREVYARLSATPTMPADLQPVIHDLMDHFDRLRCVCDDEKEFLQEILDLYQTRIANELNRFAKQVTSIGAILVVATLVAGI